MEEKKQLVLLRWILFCGLEWKGGGVGVGGID